MYGVHRFSYKDLVSRSEAKPGQQFVCLKADRYSIAAGDVQEDCRTRFGPRYAQLHRWTLKGNIVLVQFMQCLVHRQSVGNYSAPMVEDWRCIYWHMHQARHRLQQHCIGGCRIWFVVFGKSFCCGTSEVVLLLRARFSGRL